MCLTGWRGQECDTRVLPQSVDPECNPGIGCKNDGQCLRNMCCCRHNYTGHACEMASIGCLSDPCHNGARCVDVGNSYQCSCPTGLTGKQCDSEITTPIMLEFSVNSAEPLEPTIQSASFDTNMTATTSELITLMYSSISRTVEVTPRVENSISPTLIPNNYSSMFVDTLHNHFSSIVSVLSTTPTLPIISSSVPGIRPLTSSEDITTSSEYTSMTSISEIDHILTTGSLYSTFPTSVPLSSTALPSSILSSESDNAITAISVKHTDLMGTSVFVETDSLSRTHIIGINTDTESKTIIDDTINLSTHASGIYSWYIGTGSDIVVQSTSILEPSIDMSSDWTTKPSSTMGMDSDVNVFEHSSTPKYVSIDHTSDKVLETTHDTVHVMDTADLVSATRLLTTPLDTYVINPTITSTSYSHSLLDVSATYTSIYSAYQAPANGSARFSSLSSSNVLLMSTLNTHTTEYRDRWTPQPLATSVQVVTSGESAYTQPFILSTTVSFSDIFNSSLSSIINPSSSSRYMSATEYLEYFVKPSITHDLSSGANLIFSNSLDIGVVKDSVTIRTYMATEYGILTTSSLDASNVSTISATPTRSSIQDSGKNINDSYVSETSGKSKPTEVPTTLAALIQTNSVQIRNETTVKHTTTEEGRFIPTPHSYYITDGTHVAEHNVLTDLSIVTTVVYSGSSSINATTSDIIEEHTVGDKSDVSI